MSLDIDKTEIYLPVEKVDVGFVVKKQLVLLKSEKQISDRDIFEFRNAVRTFLVKVLKKILEQSPITYKLVRCLDWMIPNVFIDDRGKCLTQLNIVLNILTDSNHIVDTECDEIINQFKQFREEIVNCEASSEFSSFTVSENLNRLDTFWYNHLNGSSYKALWKIFKTLLLLSHGQASVERGFSQNKEIMVDNMSEHCLKAQRIIVDNIKHVDGIQNIQIDKQML